MQMDRYTVNLTDVRRKYLRKSTGYSRIKMQEIAEL